MFQLAITPDFLSYILAGLLAIAFDWFPGLQDWFSTLSELKKRQVMGLTLALIVLALYGLGCAGVIGGQTCDQAQFVQLAQIWFVAVGINQGVHQLTKPGKSDPLSWNSNPGQGMVEYALILVLVAVVVIVALTLMGPLISDIFMTINGAL